MYSVSQSNLEALNDAIQGFRKLCIPLIKPDSPFRAFLCHREVGRKSFIRQVPDEDVNILSGIRELGLLTYGI